jgi:hypothetical protein
MGACFEQTVQTNQIGEISKIAGREDKVRKLRAKIQNSNDF